MGGLWVLNIFVMVIKYLREIYHTNTRRTVLLMIKFVLSVQQEMWINNKCSTTQSVNVVLEERKFDFTMVFNFRVRNYNCSFNEKHCVHFFKSYIRSYFGLNDPSDSYKS